jgi:radical SAM superfamily enzyme YgiQ (UPF0313 family)
MKNKIYFLQLPLSSSTACLPQAVGTIWSYCNQDQEISKKYELGGVWWDEPIEIIEPSVVAASCYMWNWKPTYEIIKSIKEKYPKCLIIVGGPEPQYSIEWCKKHPEVDAVVAYYGEETLKKILLSDNLKLPGVVTKDFNNSSSVEYADPKNIPSPYLNGFFDSLLVNNTKPIRAIYEGNRGCPYSCSFCDIGSKMYKKIQMFDTERCLQELDWLVKKQVKVIDVADSNFGIFPRDEKLVDFLIEKKLSNEFNGSFMPTWAKSNGPQIIKLAKKLQQHGVDKIFGFSLQSTNPETLANVKRVNTYDVNDFIPILQDMKLNDVATYTELIFPLPGDTTSTFKKGLHDILDMPVTFEMIQVNSLSRLSNTEFNSNFPKLKWANILGTAKPYDNEVTDEICIATETLTEDDVFELLFYSRCFLIPMYWYGLSSYVADYVHENNIMSRSEWFINLYTKLSNFDFFTKLKSEMRNHYFDSIKNNQHFGYEIDKTYYTDTAYSHLQYVQNNIFEVLLSEFPIYTEILSRNKKDFKTIDNLNKWLVDIHIKGRFSKSWKK